MGWALSPALVVIALGSLMASTTADEGFARRVCDGTRQAYKNDGCCGGNMSSVCVSPEYVPGDQVVWVALNISQVNDTVLELEDLSIYAKSAGLGYREKIGMVYKHDGMFVFHGHHGLRLSTNASHFALTHPENAIETILVTKLGGSTGGATRRNWFSHAMYRVENIGDDAPHAIGKYSRAGLFAKNRIFSAFGGVDRL